MVIICLPLVYNQRTHFSFGAHPPLMWRIKILVLLLTLWLILFFVGYAIPWTEEGGSNLPVTLLNDLFIGLTILSFGWSCSSSSPSTWQSLKVIYSKVEQVGTCYSYLYASFSYIIRAGCSYIIHGWVEFHPSKSSGSSMQATS